MKKVLFILISIIFSCKTIQKTQQTKPIKIIETNQQTLLNHCPENGNCTFELLYNKAIVFKKDAFGISYPIINEGTKTILKYTFSKKTIPATRDSFYTEIIYAELDASIKEILLKDENLQQLKFYFGRLCYCKGETGYFAIKKGTFSITKPTKDSLCFAANFEIKEVPQLIKTFKATVSIK